MSLKFESSLNLSSGRDRCSVRGTPEKPVRAILEVPSGRGFVVGDITIDGRPIAFGGQVADFIGMKLTGHVRSGPDAAHVS